MKIMPKRFGNSLVILNYMTLFLMSLYPSRSSEKDVPDGPRRSPDGSELWLNWAGRDRATGKVIAHFQVGIKSDGVASVGYLVAKEFQGKGVATEGLQSVFSYISKNLGVREVKAWSDTRNKASHQLAKRLGMNQVEFIKDADFFKGATSDEYVFSRVFL